MPDLLVVALGGNALLPPSSLSFEAQQQRVRRTAKLLASVLLEGNVRMAITHGNGPQVGLQLLRYEYAKEVAKPYPLYVAVAETQAQIGLALKLALEEELRALGVEGEVVPLLSFVVVREDESILRPVKPIGPYYSAEEARRLQLELGWSFAEQQGKYRRLVPSPEPEEVVEAGLIARLLELGKVPVACGGGGVPVVRKGRALVPIEGVVDKDLASERLASQLGARALIMLTDVKGAYLHFGTPRERLLREVTAEELERYYQQGHFAEGSMGPKVRAAIRFVRQTGNTAVIAKLEDLAMALRGEAGTRVVSS